MTFLRKLINLSGCAKLKKKNDNDMIDNNDGCSFSFISDPVDNDSLIQPTSRPVSDQSYVPWQSPRVTSRRLMDRVRESPRLARRMLSTMTSPRPGRGHQEDPEEIFVVNMRLMGQDSGIGVAVNKNNKVDSWTSMGEDVTQWIFEYVTEDEDESDNEEEDSSDESEKDWHILKEVAESERF